MKYSVLRLIQMQCTSSLECTGIKFKHSVSCPLIIILGFYSPICVDFNHFNVSSVRFWLICLSVEWQLFQSIYLNRCAFNKVS